MGTKTVNTEKWEYYYMAFDEGHYIKIGDRAYIHALNEETAKLIVAAVNACKAINQDNPINAAKAYPDVINALQHCLSVLTKLADAGQYPFPLTVENGGEGFGFITKALNQATQ